MAARKTERRKAIVNQIARALSNPKIYGKIDYGLPEYHVKGHLYHYLLPELVYLNSSRFIEALHRPSVPAD